MNTLLVGTGTTALPDGDEVEYTIHLVVADGSGTAVEVVTGTLDGQRYEVERAVPYTEGLKDEVMVTTSIDNRWNGFSHWSRSMTEQVFTPVLPLQILSVNPDGPKRVRLDGPVRSSMLGSAIAGHVDALTKSHAAISDWHDAWAVTYNWSADQQWYDEDGVLRMPIRKRRSIFSIHPMEDDALSECRRVRGLVRDLRPVRGMDQWDPSYWSSRIAGWQGSVWGWTVIPVNTAAASRLVSWHVGLEIHTPMAASPELNMQVADSRSEHSADLADAAQALSESYWRDETRRFDDKRAADSQVAAMFAAMSEGM